MRRGIRSRVVFAIGTSARIGPNAAGIAVVVFVSLLLGSWRRLGAHAVEIPFAGVFVLLIGGHSVLGYITPWLVDIAAVYPVGVIINLTVLPRCTASRRRGTATPRRGHRRDPREHGLRARDALRRQ